MKQTIILFRGFNYLSHMTLNSVDTNIFNQLSEDTKKKVHVNRLLSLNLQI